MSTEKETLKQGIDLGFYLSTETLLTLAKMFMSKEYYEVFQEQAKTFSAYKRGAVLAEKFDSEMK